MRDTPSDKIDAGRIRAGPYGSDPSYGGVGAFRVMGPCGCELVIMSSDAAEPEAQGWEHVSVSTARRTPNWTEMSWVKDAFWREDECVVQFHPPRAEYINNHPNCLHLWRCVTAVMPRPPAILVGDAALAAISAP